MSSGETVVNESEFQSLREKLNALSYVHPLGPMSAPLVSRLLSDLLLAAQSNKEYETSARTINMERDMLAAETMPLRSENRRLVRENNQLHLEMIRQAEDFERRERGWTLAVREFLTEFGRYYYYFLHTFDTDYLF
jgi:centrosomal protein CEP135